ncbi:MAG: tetratricopeptide repeat protein [Synergistaceae bacterium]|nr:tetratricopeptide repeat protein [Synergistaceae bacterium]
MQDFYKLLNVDPNISFEDLNAEMQKQRKIKTQHANSAPKPELRREAEDFLKSLDEARKVFKDENSRSSYDKQLADFKKKQEADFEQYNKRMSESQAGAPGLNPMEAMEEARKAYDAKNYQSAVITVQKVLAVVPESTEARKLLVKIYYEIGSDLMIDAAVRELAFLELGGGEDYETYLYAGKIYHKLNEWAKAAKAYNNAIKLNPEDIEAPLSLADIFLASNDYQNAIDIYGGVLAKVTDADLQNEVKYQLSSCYYVKALTGVTFVPAENPYGIPEGEYVTEESQVANARECLEKMKSLYPDHPGITDIEGFINFNTARKFVGVKSIPVIAIIIGILSIGSAGLMGVLLIASGGLYIFGSRQRQYLINQRSLQGRGGGFGVWLATQAQQGLGPLAFATVVGLVLLPIIAIWNTVDNYVIHK